MRHEVILCNFGGPASEPEVEPFLRRLFEDPFIIRAPIPLWMRQRLARRIATKRRAKAVEEYARIGYSPINRMTEIQARQLEALLRRKHPDTRVHVVNRYTPPFASDVVGTLQLDNARHFVISLYPHLCHSTTVSSYRDYDLAFEARYGHRDTPSTRVMSWWWNAQALEYDADRLHEGLAAAIRQAPEGKICVVFSAHGVPMRYQRRGDPYVNETAAHFQALRLRADRWLAEHEGGRHAGRVSWHLSFQSRVGPVEWVKPYTDETLRALGASHGGCLLMVPISFTSDHIETLYEMDCTYKELALESGFTSYLRVKPANDDPRLAECLAGILEQHGF